MKIDQGEKDEKRTKEFNLAESISLVENHIGQSGVTEAENQDGADDNSLNEREETKEKEEESEPAKEEEKEVKFEEDDDNILRKNENEDLEFQDIEEENQEQVSIEIIDKDDEIEKKQDYRLIEKFFEFLNIPPDSDWTDEEPLNPTLCGYFCKVLQIMISHQPKEMINYIISTDYKVLDKMINFIENKSICEILIKLLNELIEHQSKTLMPGISDVPLLQQSG